MRGLHQIGLTSSEIPIDHSKQTTMTDLTRLLVEGVHETTLETQLSEITDLEGLQSEAQLSLCKKLLAKIDPHTNQSFIRRIVKSWIYFELFTEHPLPPHTKTVFDVLCDISL